jgi:hypothetical protein
MNIRLLACSLVLFVHLSAQNPETATWPTAVVTDAELFVASNSLSAAGATVLNGAINSSVTSIVVNNAAGFVAPVIITIEAEIIHCASKASNTLSGCVRGRQGTSAASHANGVVVRGYITAYHFNRLAAELKAVESFPTRRGTTPPGTCVIGDLFYDTDATVGQNLKGCTTTNNWTTLGDGGGGASDITTLTGGTQDGVPVGDGTNFAVKVIPSCSDPTASKLLYNSTTNVFSCGNDQSSGAPAITTVTGGSQDGVPVGNGTTFAVSVIPSCSNATTSKLLYNTSTNTFTCGTDQDTGGGGGTAIAVGPSGALSKNTTPEPDEIDVTAAVPLKASANIWTGANDFSPVGKFAIRVVTSDPATCDATVREMTYNSTSNLLKVCNTTNTWTTITGGGGGGGDALVANPLSQFAATTSAQLAGVLTNETGSGLAVFGTSPTIVTPIIAATDWTNAGHAHAAANSGGTLNASAIAAGIMATARLGSGTANSTTFLRGDQTWATTSSAGAPDPIDVSVISIGDEFLTGDTSVSATTGLGAENWRWNFNNAAPTISYEAPVANHFGIMQVVTSANSGELTAIQSPPNGAVIGLNGVANWTFVSVFKTDSATTNLTELYTGFGTGFGNSITIVYQPATSANWLLRTCSGFSCTDVSTGVAYANSTWFTFTIDSSVVGTVGGKVNAGSRVTSATNVYSGALPIVAIAANTNGSARTFQLDKTAFKITGIVR